MSSAHLACETTSSTETPISLVSRLSNSDLALANPPNSVVQIGVKSLGREEDSPAVPEVLVETDSSFGRLCCEIRGDVAQSNCHSASPHLFGGPVLRPGSQPSRSRRLRQDRPRNAYCRPDKI